MLHLRPLATRVLELRTDVIEERALVAMRAAVRKLCTDTMLLRKTIPVTAQALFEQPIVDSSITPGSDPGYDILRVLKVVSDDVSTTNGFKVLVMRNAREMRDRYSKWPVPQNRPTLWADEMGNLMLIPVPINPVNLHIDIAYAPRGERYEDVDGMTAECEEAIVCWASAEIMMIGGKERDAQLSRDFRHRYLMEAANIRAAVELGTSDRYVLKSEPTNRWPWVPGGFPVWT